MSWAGKVGCWADWCGREWPRRLGQVWGCAGLWRGGKGVHRRREGAVPRERVLGRSEVEFGPALGFCGEREKGWAELE